MGKGEYVRREGIFSCPFPHIIAQERSKDLLMANRHPECKGENYRKNNKNRRLIKKINGLFLVIQIIVVNLQRVFHSIRFKEEGDAAASHFSFIWGTCFIHTYK